MELREYLIDHLLGHLDVTGKGKLCIIPHGIEEHLSVLKRRGIVNVELEAAQRLLQRLGEGPADRHGFTHRLHASAQGVERTVEAARIPQEIPIADLHLPAASDDEHHLQPGVSL